MRVNGNGKRLDYEKEGEGKEAEEDRMKAREKWKRRKDDGIERDGRMMMMMRERTRRGEEGGKNEYERDRKREGREEKREGREDEGEMK